MSRTHLPYVADQRLLLPQALQEWLTEDHLPCFQSGVMDQLGLFVITARYEGERRGGENSQELLFEVFSQHYERGSILVTTNLPFDE